MNEIITKICTKCGEEKPIAEFWRKNSRCRSCHNVYMREYNLNNRDKINKRKREQYQENRGSYRSDQSEYRRNNKEKVRAWHKTYYNNNKDKYRNSSLINNFGITLEQYKDMLSLQNGLCAICGKSPEKLVVDHSHETGKVRGLLCSNCNVGLGLFGDSQEILNSAADYLEKK
jgi:hypothetical protein